MLYGPETYRQLVVERGWPSAQFEDWLAREAAGGGRVIDPELATTALYEGLSPLSPRERQVLALTHRGVGVEDIARALSLSRGTVRNHLSVAIQKLEARTRFEAARIAEEKGWL